MTDKVQKIKDWISKEQEGLMDAQGNFEYPEHEGAYHILCNLDAYIDSLQEEPVSDIEAYQSRWGKSIGFINKSTSDEIGDYDHKAVMESLCPQLKEEPTIPDIVDEHFWKMLGEEPVIKVWHDANEEQPEEYRTVVVWNPITMDGEILTRCVEVYKGRIWAYIEDLLKLSNVERNGKNWKEEQMKANTVDATIGLPYENKDGGYTHLVDVSRPLPVGDNKIAIIFKED